MPRQVKVLTRDVRQSKFENPLLTDSKNKYYLPNRMITPELRAEADELLYGKNKAGMTIKGSLVKKPTTTRKMGGK